MLDFKELENNMFLLPTCLFVFRCGKSSMCLCVVLCFVKYIMYFSFKVLNTSNGFISQIYFFDIPAIGIDFDLVYSKP